MNDKEKQIEEMAKIIKSVKLYGDDNYERKINYDSALELAKDIYNAEYRKIPEDTVVLTREEYEKLKNESIDKLFADDTFFKEEFKVTKEYLRKIANRDYIKLVKGQVRKETAKEILNMGKKLYEMSYHKSNAMPRLMEWIKVEYGVEIGEENGKRKSERD